MRMGFMPSRIASRDESLFVVSSNRGASIDALARVGVIYQLTGTTTGAVIARLLCVSTSPVRYMAIGPIYWYQADGDEFDGTVGPVALGGASFSWGASPGDRSTAGLVIPGDGSVRVAGLARVASTASVYSQCKILTLALVAGNGSWAGFIRDATPTVASIAGFGANGTPAWACVAASGQSLTTPTLTANTAFVGAPSTSAEQLMWARIEVTASGGATQFARGGITDVPGQSQSASVATGASSGPTVADRSVVFGGRGVSVCHKITEFVGVAA